MKHKKIAVLASAVAMMVCLGIVALAVAHGDKGRSLRARLSGLNEPPAVITEASGEFKATISRDETSIQYELSYENLQGTATQGHIHIGQKLVNGGVSVWLCQTAAVPAPAQSAATVPLCPATGGTVTGTITANTVTGPGASPQGVASMEFADLLKAIRSGVTYANVHTTMSPGGEIRGQIKVHDDDDNDHGH